MKKKGGRRMKPVYQIKEYGAFITGKEIDGFVTLPPDTFRQLEDFILTNRSKDADALELMGLSARKGVGRIITAKNYVGIIAMNDGTTIEILPKVYSHETDDENGKMTKRLLINMLKTLRNSPYKSLQISSVNSERMNIFEIFVRMFVDEVFFIVKRGLKCSYETVEENAKFFKGKMQFSQQIKFNRYHKERNYVEFDSFSANRPENRLLKATLQYLYRRSVSSKNRSDIKVLLNSFAEVEASVDYTGDFAKCILDRNMKDYANALLWSRVFLTGRSFTSFSGSEIAHALLFPMEVLFESYIATLVRNSLPGSEFVVRTQDKRHHLFDLPGKKFLMKPDIVVNRKSDDAVFVMDTKWKVLSDVKANYGISQADMYQMYAYQKKYDAKSVTLLYPRTEKVMPDEKIEFKSHDGVVVRVEFIDLFDASNSVQRIMDAHVRDN